MKIVYRAANPQEAHIVAGMLQSEGIGAHASGTFLQGGIGELPSGDFAVVRVPDEDAARARALVESYDDNAELSDWDLTSAEIEPSESTDPVSAWVRLLLCLAAVAFAAFVVFGWT